MQTILAGFSLLLSWRISSASATFRLQVDELRRSFFGEFRVRVRVKLEDLCSSLDRTRAHVRILFQLQTRNSGYRPISTAL